MREHVLAAHCHTLAQVRMRQYGMAWAARSIKRSAYTHLRSYQPAATNANAFLGNCNYLQADSFFCNHLSETFAQKKMHL
jgi:hypothetical protein